MADFSSISETSMIELMGPGVPDPRMREMWDSRGGSPEAAATAATSPAYAACGLPACSLTM
jgi:hypothetical protein